MKFPIPNLQFPLRLAGGFLKFLISNLKLPLCLYEKADLPPGRKAAKTAKRIGTGKVAQNGKPLYS
ncbi:MAG TPA: hypothetical protein VNO70_27430 [Blastocatellia bacterium]|nr:hypothetical protein [Blastocatellia bacterium]